MPLGMWRHAGVAGQGAGHRLAQPATARTPLASSNLVHQPTHPPTTVVDVALQYENMTSEDNGVQVLRDIKR